MTLKNDGVCMKLAASTPTSKSALSTLAHVLYDDIWYTIPSSLTPSFTVAGMTVRDTIPASKA